MIFRLRLKTNRLSRTEKSNLLMIKLLI